MDNRIPQGPALDPIPNLRHARSLFSRAGFSALGFLGAAQLDGFLVVFIAIILQVDTNHHALLTVATVLQYLLALPICCLIMRGAPRLPRKQQKPKARYLLAAFFLCALFGQVGAVLGINVTSILSDLLHIDLLNPLTEQVEKMTTAENFLCLAVLAPIFEEFLFRKLLLDRISAYGDGIAAFLSAFLFGVVHCNLYQFFYAFLLGLLFAYVYLHTGRLRYGILLHATFNFFFGFLPEWISSHIEVYNPALITVDPWQAAYLVYQFAMSACIILGFVMLCLLCRKISSDLKAYTVNLGRYFAPAMLNAGVLLTFLAPIGLFLLSLLLRSAPDQ